MAEPSLTLEHALVELGVRESSLRADERTALDRDGYLVIPELLTAARLAELRAAFEQALVSTTVAAAMDAARPETGTRHVNGLLARGRVFVDPVFSPRLLAAVHHILRRRFHLPSMHGRDPLPGFGQQGLHADWSSPAVDGVHHVATTLILLDDYTRDNGSTRVVPGSHRARDLPPKSVADPAFIHARETRVLAPAGSALVFNGHLLHSGTRNQSSAPRRTLQMSWIAFEHRSRYADPDALPADLTAVERFILGR